jgi:hypothetical protein
MLRGLFAPVRVSELDSVESRKHDGLVGFSGYQSANAIDHSTKLLQQWLDGVY